MHTCGRTHVDALKELIKQPEKKLQKFFFSQFTMNQDFILNQFLKNVTQKTAS